MDHSKKLMVLNLIYVNKDILFGKFSHTLTHETKLAKWKEITDQLKEMDIFQKDWKYLRDTTWQNWRKRALEKRDNSMQTGKKVKYDEADELVFKILHNNSVQLSPVDQVETSGMSEGQVTSQQIQNTRSGVEVPLLNRQPRKRILVRGNDFADLKKQKMEVELELARAKLDIAKRERYKLDLELIKLERELNITRPSPFTMPILLQSGFKF